jgi:hypothetical protein
MRPVPPRYGAAAALPATGAVAGRSRLGFAARPETSGLSGDSPRAREARALCWHRRAPRSCGMQQRSQY